jgi:hypothetical protein
VRWARLMKLLVIMSTRLSLSASSGRREEHTLYVRPVRQRRFLSTGSLCVHLQVDAKRAHSPGSSSLHAQAEGKGPD